MVGLGGEGQDGRTNMGLSRALHDSERGSLLDRQSKVEMLYAPSKLKANIPSLLIYSPSVSAVLEKHPQ